MQHLKVRQFQNGFMKSSFLLKYEQNIVRTLQGRNPYNFGSYFGRNDDLINSFWNLLTFNGKSYILLYLETRTKQIDVVVFLYDLLTKQNKKLRSD